MMYFVAGAVVGLLIFIVYAVTAGDEPTRPDWNSDCQYGNEYMMPDGTVVTHSDCK